MTRQEWRDQVREVALEPNLPIIDTHHHLWAVSPSPLFERFTGEEVMALMLHAGHNIVATVYADSHANYRSDGLENLRVVGETEYAHEAGEVARQREGRVKGLCAAIVTHVDLLMGEAAGEVLDAHIAASPRFRGIRHMTAFHPSIPPIYGATEAGLMSRPKFREGFAELVRRDLSFDAWMFQTQLPELNQLARDFPDARIVLDHVGGPLAIGPYAGRPDEAFAAWKANMSAIAALPNLSVKIGGLNMSSTGMVPGDGEKPYTSAQAADIQRDHILTTIDLFGPDRCMFESNFPVDMLFISYTTLWNVFKRVTADFSEDDRTNLFSGTAARVYRIEDSVAP